MAPVHGRVVVALVLAPSARQLQKVEAVPEVQPEAAPLSLPAAREPPRLAAEHMFAKETPAPAAEPEPHAAEVQAEGAAAEEGTTQETAEVADVEENRQPEVRAEAATPEE